MSLSVALLRGPGSGTSPKHTAHGLASACCCPSGHGTTGPKHTAWPARAAALLGMVPRAPSTRPGQRVLLPLWAWHHGPQAHGLVSACCCPSGHGTTGPKHTAWSAQGSAPLAVRPAPPERRAPRSTPSCAIAPPPARQVPLRASRSAGQHPASPLAKRVPGLLCCNLALCAMRQKGACAPLRPAAPLDLPPAVLQTSSGHTLGGPATPIATSTLKDRFCLDTCCLAIPPPPPCAGGHCAGQGHGGSKKVSIQPASPWIELLSRHGAHPTFELPLPLFLS